MAKDPISIQCTVEAPVDKVWKIFIQPEHIKKWNNASDDWHTPEVENDFRENGKFVYRMEAKDGSVGFNFEGVYDRIEDHKLIIFNLADDRKVQVSFEEKDGATLVEEIFEPEDTHPVELQKDGWQAILNNFKKYIESL